MSSLGDMDIMGFLNSMFPGHQWQVQYEPLMMGYTIFTATSNGKLKLSAEQLTKVMNWHDLVQEEVERYFHLAPATNPAWKATNEVEQLTNENDRLRRELEDARKENERIKKFTGPVDVQVTGSGNLKDTRLILGGIDVSATVKAFRLSCEVGQYHRLEVDITAMSVSVDGLVLEPGQLEIDGNSMTEVQVPEHVIPARVGRKKTQTRR